MPFPDTVDQMVEIADAAGGDHGHRNTVRDQPRELEIKAPARAVAVHRGQEDFSGADKVSINSAAVSRREFVKEAAEKFGDQCIVVAIDAKRVKRGGGSERWEIFTHGGRNSTGIDAIEYAQEVVSLGAGEILLTSMDRDGTRQGFDIPLTQAVADSITVPVIASGGVGNLDHLVDGIREGHATAVLAASIFHFGEFTIREAKDHMVRNGLPMRLDP